MTNKQNNQDIEPETNETEPANPCLDFDTLRKVAKYQKAMPQAIENIVNIVALIDELETSGISYVSTDELKETLLKSFKED